MNVEDITIKTYEKHAKSWSKNHSYTNLWEKQLDIFKKLLPKGKILEVGCGGGRDAKLLINSGYEYVGTDVVKNFVQIASKRNKKGIFEVKDIYNLNYPKKYFDGFWASAVLLHIPKSKISIALKSIRRCIKKGGVGFITIKEGDIEGMREEEGSDGVIYNRYWALYKREEFKDILEKNNLSVKRFEYLPMSQRTKWLIYYVEVV